MPRRIDAHVQPRLCGMKVVLPRNAGHVPVCRSWKEADGLLVHEGAPLLHFVVNVVPRRIDVFVVAVHVLERAAGRQPLPTPRLQAVYGHSDRPVHKIHTRDPCKQLGCPGLGRDNMHVDALVTTPDKQVPWLTENGEDQFFC
jgi:hypothetical protein